MSLQYHKEKLEENIEGIKGEVAEFKKTYFDEDTEWNEGLGKKAWYPLKKIGELSDHVNDQVSLRNALQIEKGRDLLPGQTWDDAALDYSFKDLRDHTAGGVGNVAGFVTGGNEQVNDAFELGAQILLPDVGDFATGGLGYVDNLGRAAKQLRKFDANDANKLFDQVLNARRFGGELTKLKNSAVQKVEEVTDAVKAPFRTLKTLVTGGPDIGIARDVSGGIRKQVLEDRLNDPRIEKFLTGKGKLKDKELSNLVQDFSNREDFMGVVSSRIDQLKEKYPHLVRQLDNQKETIALRWHHVNPSKGPIDLYKGLTDPADRAILRNTLVDEFEVFSGNHPLNNRGLSIDVHDQIHDWLGQRIGLRADALKYKWAKAAGVDVGDLGPGTGFMSNHQVLSPQGRDAFDAWFSKLKPDERLPFIREYGSIIKESETMLSDLMKQYDALFAVPEGYSISPDNEVLLKLFESIPTDGSKLVQKDIKRIIDQVNLEMPRGTLDIINKEGVVKQLNLESDIYKRIIEVKAELDAAKDLRKARSLKNELKNLEKGILQKTLDFSGAQKQGITKKRLELEKLRRQGK